MKMHVLHQACGTGDFVFPARTQSMDFSYGNIATRHPLPSTRNAFMRRIKAVRRHTTSTNRILRFINWKCGHTPDDLADRSFGFTARAVLEVHTGNLDSTTDKNVRLAAYILTVGEPFEFLDKDGKVIWYTSVSAEGITFEYEERIGGADGMNIETTYKIPKSEYPKIKKTLRIQYDLPMSLILKLIANEGLGNHFRELVLDGKIKSEKFIWVN